jgi:hypothetical protein
MQTASLDLLEKTQLPPNPVRAILQAMELEITARQEPFVTRGELRDALHSLECKIDALRSELRIKFESLRGEFTADLNAVEGRLTRWVFTCVLSQTAVMAGALYFALAHMRP